MGPELAWLAGLLEGEGAFCRPSPAHPRVALKMTDLDVVERAAAAFPGAGEIREQAPNGMGRKTLYRVEWNSAAAKDLIWAVLPMLGARRREQAAAMLADYYDARCKTCLHCGAPFFVGNRNAGLCSEPCRLGRRRHLEASR